MATLENVMQMKQQGISDPQIVQTLQQQGISPNEINEAISQSKIKVELAPSQESVIPGTPAPETEQPPQAIPSTQIQPSASMPQTPMPPLPQQGTITVPNAASSQMTQEMQPSMMSAPPQALTPQMAQEMQPPSTLSPQDAFPRYAPQYAEEQYYDEYQPQQASDIETINDIAEQIVEEKTGNLKNQITDFIRFKDELTMEVNKINERLSRVENTFNQLQTSILGKIGKYGEDIQNISKEMHATQDSFSKVIDPLTDNIQALKQMTKSAPKTHSTKPKSKK